MEPYSSRKGWGGFSFQQRQVRDVSEFHRSSELPHKSSELPHINLPSETQNREELPDLRANTRGRPGEMSQ